MKEQEIIEGNKLIAEFMKIELFGNNKDYTEALLICSMLDFPVNPCTHFDNTQDTIYLGEMRFHKSWDWLMPVVEKIEHLYEDEHTLPRFEINSHHVCFSIAHPLSEYKSWIVGSYLESSEKLKATSKIEAVYMVVINFIKWYNIKNNLNNKKK